MNTNPYAPPQVTSGLAIATLPRRRGWAILCLAGVIVHLGCECVAYFLSGRGMATAAVGLEIMLVRLVNTYVGFAADPAIIIGGLAWFATTFNRSN